MILIHVPEINNRIEYIFDFIFKEILKVENRLTTDKKEYTAFKEPKFCYGFEALDENFFKAHDLLFEKGIHKQEITFVPWNGMKVFFPVKEGLLPFDPFATAFFMVSRYEEYLPHIKDRHNRFKPEESVAFKGEFLDRPALNLWAEAIKTILKSKYPQLHFPKIPFDITPTIDINKAYAYKNMGALTTTGALIKRLIKFDFKRFIKRFSVVLGYAADPYDTYDKLSKINQHYNIKPLYFILLGDGSSFSNNLSYKNTNLISLIKSIQTKYEIGFHPSYSSTRSEKKLALEKERMQAIISTPIVKSRSHYIRIFMPKSYRELIELGITEDYSMGYPTRIGFRAGTCTPFLFYDLEKETKTNLRVYPFVMMDVTFRKYLRMRPREVVPTLRPIVKEIRELGGNFHFVFHNESLGNDREWKNWGDVYEDVVKLSLAV